MMGIEPLGALEHTSTMVEKRVWRPPVDDLPVAPEVTEELHGLFTLTASREAGGRCVDALCVFREAVVFEKLTQLWEVDKFDSGLSREFPRLCCEI